MVRRCGTAQYGRRNSSTIQGGLASNGAAHFVMAARSERAAMNYHQIKIPAGLSEPQKKKRNWRYWVGIAIVMAGVSAVRQQQRWQAEQPHTSVTDGPNGTQTIEATDFFR
jgi:hypothetical protein